MWVRLRYAARSATVQVVVLYPSRNGSRRSARTIRASVMAGAAFGRPERGRSVRASGRRWAKYRRTQA